MTESNGVYNNFVAFCSLRVELVTSPIHLFSIFFGQLRNIVSQFNSQSPRFLKSKTAPLTPARTHSQIIFINNYSTCL